MTSVSYIIYKKQSNPVLCSPNTTQNDLNTTNNDNINSCETPRKNYIILTTSNPNNRSQRISAMPVNSFNFNTIEKLPPVSKKIFVFILMVNMLRQPSVSNPG